MHVSQIKLSFFYCTHVISEMCMNVYKYKKPPWNGASMESTELESRILSDEVFHVDGIQSKHANNIYIHFSFMDFYLLRAHLLGQHETCDI